MSEDFDISRVNMRAIFPRRILARISILPKISRIWLCLRVQTDRCMTSVPCVFETLSRYFESKQYRNPGQDASGKNGTYGHPRYKPRVKVKCGQVWWPILGICALHLTHPSAHTHSSEHTPGAPWCLAQVSHLSRGIEGGRERWLFTPPTHNSCRTWDSNPQPSGYKSDSLTIRPGLPHKEETGFPLL